jgi:hypothetical protein
LFVVDGDDGDGDDGDDEDDDDVDDDDDFDGDDDDDVDDDDDMTIHAHRQVQCTTTHGTEWVYSVFILKQSHKTSFFRQRGE